MLQQQIDQDIKAAMLSKDTVRLRGLRAIKAALLNAKTEKGAGDVLTAEAESKVLQRLVKQRKESADIYAAQNRPDLRQIEVEEQEVIESYLPKQLDEQEIANAVSRAIKNSGAAGPKDMGMVMGLVNKELAGRADGKTISQKVKEMLGAL